MASIFSKKAGHKDSRRSIRVNERVPISWHIQEESITGTAKVRNLSDCGMMIETRIEAPNRNNCVLSIEPSLQNQASFLPAAGRIVWSKRNGFNPFSPQSFLWGIEFSQPSQEVISLLREKVQANLARVQSMERTVNAVGAVLLVVMLALSGYMLFQQSVIQRSYEETTASLLQSSNQQADLYAQVSIALNQTKATLAETEALLAQSREQNIALQNELQTTNGRLQAMMAENDRLTKEVGELKIRLAPFEGEIASIDQGRSYIAKVRQRLHNIKLGIRDVKRQAHLARVAAQKEKDAILLAQGNKGYFLKDSKPVVSNGASAAAQPAPKKIKIDVSIVE